MTESFFHPLATIAVLCVLLAGCGHGSIASNGSTAIVTIAPLTNSTVATGQTIYISAGSVDTSSTTLAGVTWSLSGSNCTGATCGTLTSATVSGVNYVAPTTVTGSSLSVTLTATSVSSPSTSASVNLTVVPISVSIATPSQSTVDPGESLTLNATVTNDFDSQGVTWSLSTNSCPAVGCGLLSGSTALAVTYTAPLTSTAFSVTVTAKSVADPSASASVSLNVPSLSGVFQFTPSIIPAAIVGQPYSATIQVAGGVAPYTFSATNLPGWATLTQTASDTMTITGTPTAPVSGTFLPQTANILIDAVDSSLPTGSQGTSTAALTTYATTATNNSLLNGTYAFYGVGWQDGSTVATTQRVGYIGSFTADGKGNVAGGEMDVNGPNGVITYTSLAGTYNLVANQIGAITLLPPGGNPITFTVSVGGIQSGVATMGRFNEFDDSTGIGGTLTAASSGIRSAGEFTLQNAAVQGTSTTPFSGYYVFGMLGSNALPDQNATCLAAATCGSVSLAGVFGVDSSGNISSGEEDVAVSATSVPQLVLSGAMDHGGNTDAFGRATTVLNVSNPALVDWPSHFVLYMATAQKFFAMSLDPVATNTFLAGEALQQNLSDVTTTPFSATQPAVVWGNGVGPTSLVTPNSGTTLCELSLLTATPSSSTTGTMSATINTNLEGTNSGFNSKPAVTPITGITYSVDPRGRVALSTSSMSLPVLYLADTNLGFGTQQPVGLQTTVKNTLPPTMFKMQPQTATALNAGVYTQAVDSPASPIGPAQSGYFSLATSLSATATNVAFTGYLYASYSTLSSSSNYYESNSAKALLYYSTSVSGKMSNTNGEVTVPTGPSGVQFCAGGGEGYVVSPTEVVCFSGGSAPIQQILILEQ